MKGVPTFCCCLCSPREAILVVPGPALPCRPSDQDTGQRKSLPKPGLGSGSRPQMSQARRGHLPLSPPARAQTHVRCLSDRGHPPRPSHLSQ